ncbi:hypothetical protein, partial [Geobacillus stearothermophilus]|uniref:hypothetical protein n=1 Tax=Geobacillus stearothermophilus TaxID=1422 RepID=UPI0024027D64
MKANQIYPHHSKNKTRKQRRRAISHCRVGDVLAQSRPVPFDRLNRFPFDAQKSSSDFAVDAILCLVQNKNTEFCNKKVQSFMA